MKTSRSELSVKRDDPRSSSELRLPNFLYIGPPKSGSSWLYSVLLQHPSVYVPPAKDLYFFDRFYDKGLLWYSRYFRNAPTKATAIGELSHDYLYSEEACQRIFIDLPGVRLLSILRNPIDRAISHFMQSLRNDSVSADFGRALEENPTILTHGLYGHYLKPYFEVFSRDKLGIFFFDDLCATPHRFIEDIFAFLDVDTSVEVNTDIRVNVASSPRSALVAGAVHGTAKALRSLGLANFLGRMKRSSLNRLVYRPATNEDKPVLSKDTRQYLLDYYSKDISLVEELTGRNLEGWRQ